MSCVGRFGVCTDVNMGQTRLVQSVGENQLIKGNKFTLIYALLRVSNIHSLVQTTSTALLAYARANA